MSDRENLRGTAAGDLTGLAGQSAWVLGLLGAVALVTGVLALFWPGKTLVVVALLFGIELVVTGVLRFVEAFTVPGESGGMRALLALLGVLSVIVGIWAARHLGLTILVMGLVLGTYWIVHGMLEVFVGVTNREAGSRGLRITLGVLSVLAGIVVVVWPGISLAAITWALGIWLIVLGVGQLVAAFQLRRATHAATPAAPVRPRPA